MQEGHGIRASATGHEHDLAASAQTVDGEKHLVPREVGAATRDVFEIAGRGSVQDVDHLIFCGDLLRHVSRLDERNALLSGEACIVGATGWCRRLVEGEVW